MTVHHYPFSDRGWPDPSQFPFLTISKINMDQLAVNIKKAKNLGFLSQVSLTMLEVAASYLLYYKQVFTEVYLNPPPLLLHQVDEP